MLDIVRAIITVAISTLLSVRGYSKKSLSKDGALAAFVVGIIHTYSGNYTFTVCLGVFFLTASQLTKYKSAEKAQIEDDFKEGGQRNLIQVAANAGIATVLCVWYFIKVGSVQRPFDWSTPETSLASSLIAAVVAHYACANGDTWSSELGVLSKSDPFLITTGKRVPRGTNGGISLFGTGASIAAGFVIGICFYGGSVMFAPFEFRAALLKDYPVVLFATLSGLIGSLIDSILGATLQLSMWDPEKKKVVNFLSILITTALAPYLAKALWAIL